LGELGPEEADSFGKDKYVYARLRNVGVGDGLEDKVVDLQWLMKPTRICDVVETYLDFAGKDIEKVAKETKVVIGTGEIRAFRLEVC